MMPRKKYKMELIIKAPIRVNVEAVSIVQNCYSVNDAEKKAITRIKKIIKSALGDICSGVYIDDDFEQVKTIVIGRVQEQ